MCGQRAHMLTMLMIIGRIFSSPRSEAKLFLADDACPEPSGTLLRDNEDEKRHPVSRSKVWLIEPEPMDTSPTSRAFGIVPHRPPERPRQWEAALPRGQLASKKRAMYVQDGDQK